MHRTPAAIAVCILMIVRASRCNCPACWHNAHVMVMLNTRYLQARINAETRSPR